LIKNKKVETRLRNSSSEYNFTNTKLAVISAKRTSMAGIWILKYKTDIALNPPKHKPNSTREISLPWPHGRARKKM
jgi:hypothetical protein